MKIKYQGFASKSRI